MKTDLERVISRLNLLLSWANKENRFVDAQVLTEQIEHLLKVVESIK